MKTTAEIIRSAPGAAKRGAVIIVVYEKYHDLAECLDSLYKHLPEGVAVIIVDNASSQPIGEQIARRFPSVAVIRARTNGGYAGGNNIGASYALSIGAPKLYFLNDDTIVSPGFWEACERELEREGCAIAGSLLVHHARPRILQIAGWDLDRSNLCEHFRGVEQALDEAFRGRHACDAVFGAGFMMRAEVFASLGGFDERYFHLSEELDLCLAARDAGWEVVYAGGSVVRHKGGASLAHTAPRYVYYLFRNRLWLWRRFVPKSVFWRYAPRRAGRMLWNQVKTPGRSWRAVMAACGGIIAGFLSGRKPARSLKDIRFINTGKAARDS